MKLSNDQYYIIKDTNKDMIAGCVYVLNMRVDNVFLFTDTCHKDRNTISLDLFIGKERRGRVLLNNLNDSCGMLLVPYEQSDDAKAFFTLFVSHLKSLGFVLIEHNCD